ncbi:serine--tRNA ligase [Candidatus Berkelbacteria bacterium]|nr:serine--tRNA ligase [Candidatus Berkelbacteria bacterium]
MIDLKFVRENTELVKKALAKKHTVFDVEKLLKLDDARKAALAEVETIRHTLNEAAKAKDQKEGKIIKEALKKAENRLGEAEHAFTDLAVQFHNIPHESVPSKDEGDQTVGSWGEKPSFGFKPKDHLELGVALDVIDVKRAVKMSGARFAILKNELVDVEFALIQWVFDKLAKMGFSKMLPPMLVREQAMFGTGFFPAEKSEVYKTDQDDLYLIGTAEVPLASYHGDEKIDVSNGPIKYAGFSSSFRREAGAYGKDTHGIIRLHQFDKVEQFVYCDPKTSWDEFEQLAQTSKEIFEELKLPYRQVVINAGELGAPNAKKYDFEIWIPSQNEYRELASCSHDTDFQARRLNIRTKDGALVHTLNNTALAMGRTIVAILENYQQEDGSVKMPEALHTYLSFTQIKK